jgi:hypothetical protein
LPKLIAARSVPVGASSETMSRETSAIGPPMSEAKRRETPRCRRGVRATGG